METAQLNKLTFGPVPSRRLGRSLGINNIPSKICSYACVYCQLGKTLHNQIARSSFYTVDEIVESVGARIEILERKNESIDYLAFVPDGEPTLELHLGEMFDALKMFKIPIAIISNASLICLEEVRKDLLKADWVSLKMDAATEALWHTINRPNKALSLGEIKQGMSDFRKSYTGFFATETMLVKGVNDTPEELTKIAQFLRTLSPTKSYISVPTRPPAEEWVRIPDERTLTDAYRIFTEHGLDAELITEYEGDIFTLTDDPASDILSITSVHPMRREAVEKLLQKGSAPWSVIDDLVAAGTLLELHYDDHTYYARKLSRNKQ
ncbi:MAG: radical SAM protein [Campylobacterales bacterium]|nr:radical SAM protein [Campylobacterales bacterium]